LSRTRVHTLSQGLHTQAHPYLFVVARQYSRAQEREALAHIEHRFRTLLHPPSPILLRMRTLAVTDVTVSVSTKNSAVSTQNSAVSTKNSAVNTKNSFKEIFLKILLNFCRYGGLNRAAQLGASYGSVGANCCQQIDDEHQRHVQRRERVSQARLLAAILCRNNSCRAQPQQHRRGDRP